MISFKASLYLVKKKPYPNSNVNNFKVKHVDLNKVVNNPYKKKVKSSEDDELSEIPQDIVKYKNKNIQNPLFHNIF